jgi:hypothetical protein
MMDEVTYEVVEHDEGFSYRVGDVFSEAYPTREAAHEAAAEAARRQQRSGDTASIAYEDAAGGWHAELVRGTDRPHIEVDDGGDPAPEANHDGSADVHVRRVQTGSRHED